jgi:hypothetical protein
MVHLGLRPARTPLALTQLAGRLDDPAMLLPGDVHEDVQGGPRCPSDDATQWSVTVIATS